MGPTRFARQGARESLHQYAKIASFAFPHDDYSKTIRAEVTNGSCVPASVADEFGLPELPVRLWNGGTRTVGVIVPKATVYENGPPPGLVGEVRRPRERGDVPAVVGPQGAEHEPHVFFWFGLLASYGAHSSSGGSGHPPYLASLWRGWYAFTCGVR